VRLAVKYNVQDHVSVHQQPFHWYLRARYRL
jgi:hypothetical protein